MINDWKLLDKHNLLSRNSPLLSLWWAPMTWCLTLTEMEGNSGNLWVLSMNHASFVLVWTIWTCVPDFHRGSVHDPPRLKPNPSVTWNLASWLRRSNKREMIKCTIFCEVISILSSLFRGTCLLILYHNIWEQNSSFSSSADPAWEKPLHSSGKSLQEKYTSCHNSKNWHVLDECGHLYWEKLLRLF